MEKLGSSPFCWLQYDASGNLVEAGALAALQQTLNTAGAEDLVVVSHGWNNSKEDAHALYAQLWANTSKALKAKNAKKIVVCGIQWPSKQFRTDFDVEALASAEDSATLSAKTSANRRDLTPDELEAVIGDVRDLFGDAADDVAEAARAAGGGLTGTTSRQLLAAIRDLIDVPEGDSELKGDARPILKSSDPQMLLSSLANGPQRRVDPKAAATMGLGSAIGSAITGARAAAARLLNFLTYYEMKKRAGIVGNALGKSGLPTLRPDQPARLHLIGHSFGARLVSAAAEALPPMPKLPFTSLTLLQGAFSHNAYRKEVTPGVAGAFPHVIQKASGPLAVTHTHNDLACTLAYAFASRLSGDIAAAIGDKNDIHGAMGANGPQGMVDGTFVADHAGTDFKPVNGMVNTFLADSYIIKTGTSDAHNNVANATVGQLVAAVIEA